MYLDFKNGKGVRFLRQYGQGILPINNHELSKLDASMGSLDIK